MKTLTTLFGACILSFLVPFFSMAEKIDREAVVKRHKVVTTGTLLKSPAQVGNGKFAFGMDITGLQTFVPFNTMSDWGWHSFPVPEGVNVEEYLPPVLKSAGKDRMFETSNKTFPKETEWLSKNPHKINLGRIALEIINENGEIAIEADLKHCRQEVDMWTGIVTSRFEIDRSLVTVTTVCDPEEDMLGITVQSDLLKDGRLKLYLDFPYPDDRYFRNYLGDFDNQKMHSSVLKVINSERALINRRLDSTTYDVCINSEYPITVNRPNPEAHKFYLKPTSGNKLSFSCNFGNAEIKDAVKLNEKLRINGNQSCATLKSNFGINEDQLCAKNPTIIAQRSAEAMKKYWTSGAAVDFSCSKDPRWLELERRVVLSQYIMRINEAGLFPPQESGLVNNGWFGRFHFEMIWWHGVHYGLWNRMNLFDKYLNVYQDFLGEAKDRAKREGRTGARWPKCTAYFNREWPCSAHGFLIWHEPHPIYFAEMDYRINPSQATLEKWKDVVVETANYMADFPVYDKKRKKYVMDAPIVVVSENTDPFVTRNPVFELGYWRYGLRTALAWGKRLGIADKTMKKWQTVLNNLSELPTENGFYITYEGMDDMWNKKNYEHPALTGIFGTLPGDGVDTATFKKTLAEVVKKWNFDKIWGWDFPMLAMAAARTNQPALAIDMLMHPAFGFQFDEHGLATGGPFPYFPSNGALLTAVAMMCQGWDGAQGEAPGFPKDGSWNVKYEGFVPMQ